MKNKHLLARNTNWQRSADDGLVFGVCAGIARKLGVEAWTVRIFWLLSILLFGTGIFVYLVLALSLPKDSELDQGHRKRFLGVCERLSQKLDVDVGVLRAVFVCLAFATLGVTLLAYIILYVVLEQDSQSPVI